MDVEAYRVERAGLVDAALEARVPSASTPPASLHAAMRHLLFPGGKRLRPVFAMAAAEAVGGRPEQALPVAMAVELVHTYSLVHDDLPCMDDDAVRRGRPTVHVVHGEALAVLAGDALQALAFEVLAEAAARTETTPPDGGPGPAQGALRDLAAAAGSAGLVGGQVDDLAAPVDASAAAIESVHARKSAALFSAAASGGARLAGAEDATAERLARFGREVGVAFQIADDLLDEDEDADSDEGCSLVRVLGPDTARQRAGALLDGALRLIEDWGERAEPLRECAGFAVRRVR